MKGYPWRCVCGEKGHGENSAREHAEVCGLMGRPWTNPSVEEQP